MKYLHPSFDFHTTHDTSHPKAGDWEEIFKKESMKYYTINPETGEKELVGATGATPFPEDEFKWAVDPRSLREDELVYDEDGVPHNLKEISNEED